MLHANSLRWQHERNFQQPLWTPTSGARSPASTSTTSPTTGTSGVRAGPNGTVRIAFDRPDVRNAFRPHTVDELYRVPSTMPAARPTSGTDPAHRQRPQPQGRRVGVLLRRRSGASAGAPATSTPARARRGRGAGATADECGTRRGSKAEGGRLHILEVQRLIRTMPKVVICRGQRLGGRRRAQRCTWSERPHPGLPRARPLQADRLPTWGPSTPATAAPTSPSRSARSTPREIFFLGQRLRSAERDGPHGRGQPRSPTTPTSRPPPSSGRGMINGKSPDRAADAQVRVQTSPTTA
jgi:hypothetical protein